MSSEEVMPRWNQMCKRYLQKAMSLKDKRVREEEQAWRASRSQGRSVHCESSAVLARLTGSKAGVTQI